MELEKKIKRLEKELLEARQSCGTARIAQKNYKRFLKFLPSPVLIRNDKGRVSFLNKAFTDTFGWHLEELKGTYGGQYVPGHLKGEMEQKISSLPAHKHVLEFATQRLTRDGRLLDVIIRIGIDRGTDNQPAGMITVLKDVTMEKRNRLNQNVMNRISRMLPRYPDLRKLLFFINSEIKELLGVSGSHTVLLDKKKKEFVFYTVVHDDTRARARIENSRLPLDEMLAAEVVKTGIPLMVNQPLNLEKRYRLREKTMGYKIRNVLQVPLRSKDRIIGILAADNKKTGDFDQTDLDTLTTLAGTVALSIEKARVSSKLKKAYKELKSLNRAKDKMISHLSHELKTPVAILLTSVKILSRRLEALPEDTWRPAVDRMKRNLDRIIGIEGELQDIVERKEFFHTYFFSLIFEQCLDELEALVAEQIGETGLIRKIRKEIEHLFSTRILVSENIYLDQFVKKRIETIKPLMAHRTITLNSRLMPCPPIRIPADPLRKTVDGLIRNAVENTPDGGSIQVLVAQTDKTVKFVVKDHGIGLTEEAQKRIFEGFFTTQETLRYSSKRPFDFNAGGKGADLLRMKIFSERFNFKISMTSRRCRRIPENMDACPGSIKECQTIKGPECDGRTRVSCLFPLSTHTDDAADVE